jgi:hypothetical protein
VKIFIIVVSSLVFIVGCSERKSKTAPGGGDGSKNENIILAPAPPPPPTRNSPTLGVKSPTSGKKPIVNKDVTKSDDDSSGADIPAESPPPPEKIKSRTSGHKVDMQATEDIE